MFRTVFSLTALVFLVKAQCGQESADGTCPTGCQLGAGNICTNNGSPSVCSNGGAPKGHPTASHNVVSCPSGYQVEGNWCCPTAYSSDCQDSHPHCQSWVQNGFCTNYYYTQQHRKNMCAKSCSLCNG